MRLPIADINAQNLRMSEGADSAADIQNHVNGWIRAHQATFDGWIASALGNTGNTGDTDDTDELQPKTSE